MRLGSPLRPCLLPQSSLIFRAESFRYRYPGVCSKYAIEGAPFCLGRDRLFANRSSFDRLVMIAARFHPAESSQPAGNDMNGRRSMESHTSGTMAGTGSWRCQGCGYVLTLTSLDALRDCPECGSQDFVRASLFSAAPSTADARMRPESPETSEWV